MQTMQQTSLFAFREIQKVLGPRQRAVYEVLARNSPRSMTDKQISQWLNIPINEITPRRGELVKMGMIRKAGIVKQDGRSAICWEVGSIA